MTNQIKILVIAPAWVGDMVMSQVLFKLLKQKYGDRLTLDVFAGSFAKGVLERMPEVNQVIDNPFNHGKLLLWQRVKVGFKLRYEKYNQVIVLPNSLKSAIVPFFSGIKKRTGFVGESRYIFLNDIYKLHKKELPLMIDRFSALVNDGRKPENIPYPELRVDVTNQEQLANKLKLNPDKPIIAFCPAAEYGPAKRWLPEHFAALADILIEDNYQVVILGSNKDTKISQEIIKNTKTKGVVDACGVTNLVDAIDLLGLAKIVITNDSGLMHIASAVGAHVIAIYGSSSPGFTPPLTSNKTILQTDLECQPCFARTCKFEHYNCLYLITPQLVYDKIAKLCI